MSIEHLLRTFGTFTGRHLSPDENDRRFHVGSNGVLLLWQGFDTYTQAELACCLCAFGDIGTLAAKHVAHKFLESASPSELAALDRNWFTVGKTACVLGLAGRAEFVAGLLEFLNTVRALSFWEELYPGSYDNCLEFLDAYVQGTESVFGGTESRDWLQHWFCAMGKEKKAYAEFSVLLDKVKLRGQDAVFTVARELLFSPRPPCFSGPLVHGGPGLYTRGIVDITHEDRCVGLLRDSIDAPSDKVLLHQGHQRIAGFQSFRRGQERGVYQVEAPCTEQIPRGTALAAERLRALLRSRKRAKASLLEDAGMALDTEAYLERRGEDPRVWRADARGRGVSVLVLLDLSTSTAPYAAALSSVATMLLRAAAGVPSVSLDVLGFSEDASGRRMTLVTYKGKGAVLVHPSGGTPLARAMSWVVRARTEARRPTEVFLFTDGEPSEDDDLALIPDIIAQGARRGVRFHPFLFEHKSPESIPAVWGPRALSLTRKSAVPVLEAHIKRALLRV